MKTILLSLLILFTILNADAQIVNGGFELTKDTSSILPKNWGISAAKSYKIALDTSIYFSGHSSLRISNQEENDRLKYATFSQSIGLAGDTAKCLTVSVRIRKTDPKSFVRLWLQVRDKNKEMIDYYSIESDSTVNQWQKYTVNVILERAAKKIVIGGLLQGKGSAWFDDINFREIKTSNQSGSPQAKAYTQAFIGLVKKNSLYADSLDWTEMHHTIAQLSKGANTIQDVKFLNDYILHKLSMAGDNHSFIEHKGDVKKNKSGSLQTKLASSKLLKNNIGYIYLPGISSINRKVNEKFATILQAYIKKLDMANEIQGWIIDLRENYGGNMYPMLAGIGPLLGKGPLGYFSKKNGIVNITNAWYYNNGKAISGNKSEVSVKPFYSVKQPAKKIAILISGNTTSSGEMTAISFIGNKNARLFGQISGGYTTGNERFSLSDGDVLVLATSYTADRNKKIYMGRITPDEIIPESTDKEVVIKAATDWIMK